MFWNIFNLLFLSAKSKFRMNASRTYLCVFIYILTLTVFQPDLSCAACSRELNCVNGYCDSLTEECVCYDGWQGENCDHCGGRARLVETSGHILESPANYKTSHKCSWLIDSQRNNTPIHLELEEFATECGWDHLFIYDGDSIHSPLVAALSGPVRYDTTDIRHQFTLTSGFAYLYFYSDAAYSLDGFNISYSIGDCRDRNCSGNGICNTEAYQCQCFEGWTGEGCNIPTCPNDCGTSGNCVAGQCICNQGFYGRDCGTEETEGLWEVREESTVFSRASAASVMIADELWLIGGYDFIKESSMPVFKYNFTSGISVHVPVTSESGNLPQPRYGHSAALYEDVIIIYGGSLIDGPVSSELWFFNITSLSWVQKDSSGSKSMEGHTAHMVNGSMLVFFGYNPTYGYVGWVQQYNISSNSWSILDVTGFPVLGSYGHASVYSEDLGQVFVYGGYPFVRIKSFTQDPFYVFDVHQLKWTILPSPGRPRFLHSAVIEGSRIYVFGGNSHTDSNEYRGAKCYTDSFIVYNIDCKEWYEEEVSSGLKEEVSRYGHQAAWYNDMMWTFGGFNGVILNSVNTYTPVNCSLVTNETNCELAGNGPTCMWDLSASECLQINLNETIQHNASFLECDPTDSLFNCSTADSCITCIEKQGCGWCDDQCSSSCTNESQIYTCGAGTCPFHVDCHDCNREPECRWVSQGCSEIGNPDLPKGCVTPCASQTGCSDCTSSSGCMWCESQNRCIDSQTYMSSFPFGTCLAWVTSQDSCNNIKCSDYHTCELCHEDPACGWCDQGDGTGLGTCMGGSNAGPLNVSAAGSELDFEQCPASDWYFTECPSCQCNGHSICVDGENCSNCSDFTTGEECDSCLLGYHGIPLNGANCSRCECNGHSEYCDQNAVSSKCYCDTKGVLGDQCDRCDELRGYKGNPTINTCFYELLMNFKYTFQLDDTSGENLTKINLYVQPSVQNRDIEFILNVNEPVNFTISYTTTTVEEEQIIVNDTYVDDVYRYRFSRYTYDFRNEVNTTFLFYLSDFTHPFTFRVTVMSAPLISMGLIVLLATSPIWIFVICGIILKFYLWIRTAILIPRQREVEMAVMASRPFASIFVELVNNAPPDLIPTTKSKPTNAVGVAIEPLKDSKVALTTIIMQLPYAEGQVPTGQSRVTLATALVNQKGKKQEVRVVPEINEPTSPRMSDASTREATPNGRPNTARDIEVSCDDTCNHGYDNPAMV
ncbi:attractin-like protein 1 isoform X5 [Apostichopus japonicus]|uniref:attractin-like protein 1 isoform X5 n=1 Tax=Stichopus japonicus TaxID=307972 RepID=UPI003AB8BB3D